MSGSAGAGGGPTVIPWPRHGASRLGLDGLTGLAASAATVAEDKAAPTAVATPIPARLARMAARRLTNLAECGRGEGLLGLLPSVPATSPDCGWSAPRGALATGTALVCSSRASTLGSGLVKLKFTLTLRRLKIKTGF